MKYQTIAKRNTFTKSGVRCPSRNKPLLPFSPHSSVLRAPDMLNEGKLGVSQALITHCETQISILTAKSGRKSPTRFFFLKISIQLDRPEKKNTAGFASTIYTTDCKEARREDWGLTESRRSCGWRSGTV